MNYKTGDRLIPSSGPSMGKVLTLGLSEGLGWWCYEDMESLADRRNGVFLGIATLLMTTTKLPDFREGSVVKHKHSGHLYVITSVTWDGFEMTGITFPGLYHSHHREWGRWEIVPPEPPVIARKKLGRVLDL